MSDYLDWLRPRLEKMRRLLTNSGSIYVHCDWHASHYIKVEMDKIFGYDRFINEIVWHYESGGRAAILSAKTRFAAVVRQDRADRFLSRGRHGAARQVSGLRQPTAAVEPPQAERRWRGPSLSHDQVGGKNLPLLRRPADHAVRHLDGHQPSPAKGPRAGRLSDAEARAAPGARICGVTREGGLVADFFCGSGTTAVVAGRLGRRWIACDQSPAAVALAAGRLRQVPASAAMPDFTVEHTKK